MPTTTLIPLCPLDVAQYLDVQAPDNIRIKGRRIGIEHIVYYYQEGYSPEQIAQSFPGLELKVIYTIIAYYLHHQAELDAYIAQLDAEVEAARRTWTKHRSPASLRVEAILKQGRIRFWGALWARLTGGPMPTPDLIQQQRQIVRELRQLINHCAEPQ